MSLCFQQLAIRSPLTHDVVQRKLAAKGKENKILSLPVIFYENHKTLKCDRNLSS